MTGDVTDVGDRPSADHAGVMLLYDDTMPAYRIASALITMVDVYPGRDAFTGREHLDTGA